MATSVGSVYATLALQGYDALLQQLKTVTAQLDALNSKKVTIGIGGAQGDTQRAASNIDNLVKQASKLPSVFEGASRIFRNFGSAMEHTGQIAATFGYRMSIVAAPIAALGAVGVKASNDMEQSLRLASTQLDNLDPNAAKTFVDQTSAQLSKLSVDVKQDTKDMADSIYYLVSTLTIDPSIARNFVDPLAKFSTAISSTTEESTKAIVPILNVWKQFAQGPDELNKVLEILFQTIRRGSGDPKDIARQVGDFAEISKLAGAKEPTEPLAIFAQSTRLAGSPSEAATWTKQLYQTLINPDTMGKLKELGISISEIKEGTGEWINTTDALDKKSQSTYSQIIRKLQGGEGVTGLYKQLALEERRLADAQAAHDAKPSQTTASRVDKAKFELDTTRAQIANLEAQRQVLEKSGKAFTGETVSRQPLEVFKELFAYIDKLPSVEAKFKVIKDIFPNVRGEQGFLALGEAMRSGDIEKWIGDMNASTGSVDKAFNIMADSVENKLKGMWAAISAAGADVYNTVIKPVLIPIIDKITELAVAFQKASPEAKQLVAQFVIFATAAGPVSLVIGTFLVALGELVTIVGALLSPAGIIGLGIAIAVLREPFGALTAGVASAGGGLQGFARFIAEVAIQLGLVKQQDLAPFFEKLGISTSGLGQGFGDLHDKAAAFITKAQEVVDGVMKIADAIGKVISFLAENPELVQGAGFVIMASKVLGVVTALTGSGGLLGALNLVAAHPLIAAAIGGIALTTYLIVKGSTPLNPEEDSTSVESVFPGQLANDNQRQRALAIWQSLGKDSRRSFVDGLIDATEDGEAGMERFLERFTKTDAPRYMTAAASDLLTATQSQNAVNAGLKKSEDKGLSDFTAQNTPTFQDDYTLAGRNPFARSPLGRATTAANQLGGNVISGAQSLGQQLLTAGQTAGRPTLGQTTPTGMNQLVAFGGQQWVDAFAGAHGGKSILDYYSEQGYQDPTKAAMIDKNRGDEFFKKHGRGMTDEEWKNSWYEVWGDSFDKGTDGEGKDKKQVKKSPLEEAMGDMDAFKEKVEGEKGKALSAALAKIPEAMRDEVQKLLDRLSEIIGQTYTINVAVAYGSGGDGGDAKGGGGSGGGDSAPTRHHGGPIPRSGLYNLLQGEYVVSNMQQQQAAFQRMTANPAIGASGDKINISVSGAEKSPREIAQEVAAMLRFERSRVRATA